MVNVLKINLKDKIWRCMTHRWFLEVYSETSSLPDQTKLPVYTALLLVLNYQSVSKEYIWEIRSNTYATEVFLLCLCCFWPLGIIIKFEQILIWFISLRKVDWFFLWTFIGPGMIYLRYYGCAKFSLNKLNTVNALFNTST